MYPRLPRDPDRTAGLERDPTSVACRYRDRESSRVVTEGIFPENLLRFLYERPFGRVLRRVLLQHRTPSRIYGWLQRRPRSRERILGYVEKLGINISEAEQPLESYKTIDEFFSRRLKPGARPIDEDPCHLLSPADGCATVIPRLHGNLLSVKNSSITLAELVGNARIAEAYDGGAAVLIRLRPSDYHRFHFPDAGVAAAATEAGRRLHSVHPIALRAGAASFKNKRMLTTLSGSGFGEMILVEVGALAVGTIVQTYMPGPVKRGDEKGFFRIGGSCVVILIQPDRVCFDDDLVHACEEGLETLVKMGTRIGRRA